MDNAAKGDTMREEEKMESELAKSYIEEESPQIVDPVEEVRDVVQDALDAEAEALIDLLSDNESKEDKPDQAKPSDQTRPNSFNPLKEKFVKQKGKHANISMRQFWRYRMFYRDNMDDANNGKDHRYHWLWVMRKLAEFFVITVENRSDKLLLKFKKIYI